MRNLLILLLALMLGAKLPGCRRTPSTRLQAMSRAEALMDSFPDSALAVMRGVSIPAEASRREHALYALLLTQALDKNYIDVADDSLIAVADEYYRTTSDTRRQMLSAFYRARVRFNALDYPRSLRLFTESLELAAALSDPFWQARAASEIAAIYNRTHHPSEELEFSLQALHYGRLAARQPYLNYHMLGYANACVNQIENDSIEVAESLGIALLDSARLYNDDYLYGHVNVLLCKIAYVKGLWDRCICYGESALNTGFSETDITGVLGVAYLQRGEMNKAIALLPDVPDSNDVGMLQFAYKVAVRTGDKDKAISMLHRMLFLQDSILNRSLKQNYTQAVSSYYAYENEIKNLRIANMQASRWLMIGGFVVLLLAAVGIFLYVGRKKNYKLQQALSVVSDLQNLRTATGGELDEARRKVERMLSERFKEINAILSRYYDGQHSVHVKRQLSEEIKLLLSEFSNNQTKLTELREYLDCNADNVYSDFERDFPNLQSHDYLLFLYNGLGMSSTAISLLLGVDKESVYNRKGRLKIRIKSVQPHRMNDYLSILRDTTKKQ